MINDNMRSKLRQLARRLEEIDGIIAQHKDTSGFQPEMNR